MAWGDIKFDKTWRIPVNLRLTEYLLKNHNVEHIDLPDKRTGAVKGVTICGLPVLFKDDDAKEHIKSMINGEISEIPHYIDCIRSTWHIIDDSEMWLENDKENADTIGIAAVITDGVGIPEMYKVTPYNDIIRLTAYVLKQNKLTANDVTAAASCPEYVKKRWKRFIKAVDAKVVSLGGKSTKSS